MNFDNVHIDKLVIADSVSINNIAAINCAVVSVICSIIKENMLGLIITLVNKEKLSLSTFVVKSTCKCFVVIFYNHAA